MAAAVQQANVASAEPPLADWRPVATSATAEPPLPGEEIKHRFVHVNAHEKWLGRMMHIDVNYSLMVRINGGPWHGAAQYGKDGEKNAWELWFHCKADESKMKLTRFHQIPETNTYLHLAPAGQSSYNAMLILKVD